MMKLQEVASIVETLESSNPIDALGLVKSVERESRREFGARNIEFYSRPKFISSMVNVGKKYIADEIILEYIVRIIKTISERCPVDIQENQKVSVIHDPRTLCIYEFLFGLKYSTNKKIRMLVAHTIPFFPQFDEYEKRWEYILAIPKIAPKDDSMRRFRWIIEQRIAEVPDELKGVVIDMFQKFLDTHRLDIDTRQRYVDLIEKLS